MVRVSVGSPNHQPHPDGPTMMTWNQLQHEQNALVRAHKDGDVSRMLRGVVSNMHLLAKLSREAGFLPYIGPTSTNAIGRARATQAALHLIVILAQCGPFKWTWTRTSRRRVPWP